MFCLEICLSHEFLEEKHGSENLRDTSCDSSTLCAKVETKNEDYIQNSIENVGDEGGFERACHVLVCSLCSCDDKCGKNERKRRKAEFDVVACSLGGER